MKTGSWVKQTDPGLFRRLGWGLTDQAVSSASNFALALIVARTVSVTEFGAFSVALATYTLALGISRAVATEPLAVRYGHVQEKRWRTGTEMATGMAVSVGALLGTGCVVAGVAFGGALQPPLMVLGLSLPGLLLQDSWRFAFFLAGRGRQAVLNDLVWTLLLAGVFALLLASGPDSLAWLMAAWGASGTVAAVVGMYQSAIIPRPKRIPTWWREHRDLAPRFVGEFAASTGTLQLSLYGVGAVAGLTALGAIRAAYLLLGPLHILLMGVGLMAVPEGVRLLRRSPHRLWRAAVLLSTVQVTVVMGWGALLLTLPTRLGTAVLGGAWGAARPVLLPVTITVAGLAALAGAHHGLRSLGAAQRSFRVRVITAPAEASATVGGAALTGVHGAVWGNVIAVWFGVALWWRQFARALRAANYSGTAPETAEVLAGELLPQRELR